MNTINAMLSMCAGSVLLSLLLMITALSLAYVARRWMRGVGSLSDI